MKSRHFTKYLIFASILMVVSCGDSSRTDSSGAGLATGQPGMNTYPADPPGETVPMERAYETAPPLVPHDVTDLEVSRAANDCVDCHLEGMELDEGHVATKIPESHFRNEFTGETTEERVVGIRYNCLQCHVPQATVN